LTEGLQSDYENLLPVGSKISKTGSENALFKVYGRGVATSRDAWVYNFKKEHLSRNMQEMIKVYNKHVKTWGQIRSKPEIEEYIGTVQSGIPWSDSLKNYLQRQVAIKFSAANIRNAAYRPFVQKYLYFDQHLIERWYQIPQMLPNAMSEGENRIICVTSPGSKNISAFMTNMIPNLNLFAGASPVQCFPLYYYDRDVKERRENISDWAHHHFIEHYQDRSITKFDIFHYIYAVLHLPEYIRKYSANLRKQLPRIPFIHDFNKMVKSGKNLARLHLFYQGQAEYPLKKIQAMDKDPAWNIEKMSLSKNRNSIRINDYLTITNIPPRALEYQVGNRAALEWIIDQYRCRNPVKKGYADDPNDQTDPDLIIRLIGQIITVSIETIKIINELPHIDTNQI
jgi:predicted helicase